MNYESKVAYIYINGLGDGSVRLKERLMRTWWRRAGIDTYMAQVNWYDGETFVNHLADMTRKVEDLLARSEGVAIIGSSAGGSLALNTFYQLRSENVCVINAHGRLASGEYKNHNSLHRRAHLNTSRPSQSFYDSVRYTENNVIPKLTKQEKQRILVLSQLSDLVVPTKLMSIKGVHEHKSFAFGHSGGFFAHLFVDRNLIIDFAENALGQS